MSKKEITSTVRIYKKRIGTLNTLCKRSDRSQVDYISQAVWYINKTGMDIFSEAVDDIPGLIKGLDNRMVSFLKQREKDFFLPMQTSFIQQVAILKQVLTGLENFDVIDFMNNTKKSTFKNEQNLIIPIAENEQNLIEKTTVLNEEKKDIFIAENSDKYELLYVENEELKNENKIYKENIEFLLKNIKAGSPLSGVKFVINIQQNDIRRIENLLN